jgi:hypothetical protein
MKKVRKIESAPKIISRRINDKRQKATTYPKFPLYSQTTSQNGLSQVRP